LAADDHQPLPLLDLAARAFDLVEKLLEELVELLARQARGGLDNFESLGAGHRRTLTLAQLIELLHQLTPRL